MQHFTLCGAPQGRIRDGWWLTVPEKKLLTPTKKSRTGRVSVVRGYRNAAVARNLAALGAAPSKGQ